MDKKVEYSYITGSILSVLPSLERSIRIFEKKYRTVKVGVTGRDPQIRFNEHLQNRKWDRMIVKYKTTSENFVNRAEKYFILGHRELKNKWTGYSNLPENGDKYFYILLYGKNTNTR